MDARVDWKIAAGEPAAQLWRMNLHYMEYLESASNAVFCELVEDWIAGNRAYMSGSTDAPWHAYVISLRTVVWLQQLARRNDRLTPSFRRNAERSIAAQLIYLERHLESDVGGNHLIKNIKALLWASVYFEGAAASRWRRRGLGLLRRELGRQFLPDGFHFELSPSYHCQVLADLLEIRWALGADPFGGVIDLTIGKAAQVAADLCHPDGRVALFGDAGLRMAYAPAECLDAYRELFGDAPSARAEFLLPQSGYAGVREADCYAVADIGPIGPASLPAHSHGDIFSFEWSVDGQRIVVDQGVYEYSAGDKRHASRTAASHNTLHIPGRDQADFFGAFRCGRRATVQMERCHVETGRAELEGGHDGYAGRSGTPVHRRRFELQPRRISIRDRLDAPVDVPSRISLLLHPSTAVQQIDSGTVRLTCGKAAATVAASLPLQVEEAVWWPDAGVEAATVRLVAVLPPHSTEAWMELAAEAANKEVPIETG